MKKQTIIFLFTILTSIVSAQNTVIETKVDERVELISVVCRLAGYEEYSQNYDYNQITYASPEYSKNVASYFEKFKSDSLIQFAKKIHKKQGIGYDAPMTFAISLEIKDNIQFIGELEKNIEELDSRWTKESANEFLRLLNKFYIKTNFHSFFNQHKPVYNKMETAFNDAINNIRNEWFESFYGIKRENDFSIILSCLNGDGSYGPKNIFKNGAQKTYSILGPWIFDSTLNIPINYIQGIQETVIHEFNHSFCNPLIDKYMVGMERNSTRMFKCVKSTMKNQAYGSSKIMMSELLVRSCVIKYLEDNSQLNKSKLRKALINERLNGFYWIDSVYSSLQRYAMHRDKYPTLESYMSELVKQINSFETKKYLIQYNKNRPELNIQTSIINGDINVSPETNKLIVKFDRKMDTGANGATYGKKGKKYHPEIIKAYWNNENQQEWILEIKLEPNKEYSIAFPCDWFRDENGYTGKKGTYYLDFKTIK